MCETSGSCAIPKQSSIIQRYPVAQKNEENKNSETVINEPKKTIDETKQVCFYA